MPVVVSYEAIDALGPAAFQAGYQPGYAGSYQSGRESQLARQHSDTQMLMGNVFQRHNMERQYQLQGQQARENQGFQAEQADKNRQFEVQQAARQFGYHTAIQGQQQGFSDYERQQGEQFQSQEHGRTLQNQLDVRGLDQQNKIAFERLQAQLGTRKAIEVMQQHFAGEEASKSRMGEKERSDYIDRGLRSGQFRSPEEAGQKYDLLKNQQTGKEGPFATRGAAGKANDLLGTLSGQVVQDAMLALERGAGSGYLMALGKKPAPSGIKEVERQTALGAMHASAVQRMSLEQLQQAVVLEQDPELKQVLGHALTQRVAYGANQPPQGTSGGPGPGYGGGLQMGPPSGGNDLSRFSTEQLRQMLQSTPQ